MDRARQNKQCARCTVLKRERKNITTHLWYINIFKFLERDKK